MKNHTKNGGGEIKRIQFKSRKKTLEFSRFVNSNWTKQKESIAKLKDG